MAYNNGDWKPEPKEMTAEEKELARGNIESDVDKFLKNGGKIQKIPSVNVNELNRMKDYYRDQLKKMKAR